jgi:hypothetical protein
VSGRGRDARRLALVFALFLALSVAATWPLAGHATQFVIGHAPRESTPPLNTWAMAVVLRNLLHQPLHLFDGNAFYPYARSLAFSEHLFVPALLAAPWVLVTGNWALAYNAVTFLTLSMAGLGMYLLARELTGHPVASLAAGALYAFHTWNMNELVRLQIVSNQYFPFVLLGLLRFFAAPRRATAVLTALALVAQALSCMYWALYLPLFVGAATLYLQWRHRLPLRRLAPLLAAFAVTLAVMAVFAIPYAAASGELGFRRPSPEPLQVNRYLDVLPKNVLYASLLGRARYGQNAAHFLGFASMALGVVGLMARRVSEDARRVRPLLAGLVAGGWLFSLGPALQWGDRPLLPGPYLLLYHLVPGFRSVRYPERLSVFLVLGLAPLVAIGLARLAPLLGRVAVALIAAFVFLEHLSIPQGLATLPSGRAVPEVYRWLAAQEDVRVVTEVPASNYLMERLDALPMYYSAIHWKPTPQGYTSYFPPIYNLVKWQLFRFPNPESLAFLELFGVDTVVVGPEWDRELPPRRRWETLGPFPGGHRVVRLRWARKGVALVPPRPPDGLVELSPSGWQASASAPGAEAAFDRRLDTAWQTAETQGAGDYYRVSFAGTARVARVSLAVRRPWLFPTELQLFGERADSDRVHLPYDVTAAYAGLGALMLSDHEQARLDIDVAPQPLRGLEMRIARTDGFSMPWRLPELRVFVAP